MHVDLSLYALAGLYVSGAAGKRAMQILALNTRTHYICTLTDLNTPLYKSVSHVAHLTLSLMSRAKITVSQLSYNTLSHDPAAWSLSNLNISHAMNK